uniref:DUF6715 family protein n=1 Tax=Agathobacter sp. TaxID=2021311 RepID=UPI0040560D22
MKNMKVVLIAVACILLICGGFYFSTQNNNDREEDLTEVEKIITKDLENDYFPTPREVVKFYNRIVECYYDPDMEEAEIKKLAVQMRNLFDKELLLVNSEEDYIDTVLLDVADYRANERYIVESDVADSKEIEMITDKQKGDKLAYVPASYFIKQGDGNFVRTHQKFVLRKDEEGRWKILTMYLEETVSDDE